MTLRYVTVVSDSPPLLRRAEAWRGKRQGQQEKGNVRVQADRAERLRVGIVEQPSVALQSKKQAFKDIRVERKSADVYVWVTF